MEVRAHMPGSEKQAPEHISGERRDNRRYGLILDLKWRLVRRRKVLETGSGRTLDLSSGGILFEAGRQLPLGLQVEMSIAWPALLHDIAPMQLVVAGRIIRSEGVRVAIQMTQHEFRTTGSAVPERRGAGRAGNFAGPATGTSKLDAIR
jgi:hypothetical protein